MVDQPVVTPTKAARILGKSRSTIYRMIDKGHLIPMKNPRKTLIPREQVENIRLGRA